MGKLLTNRNFYSVLLAVVISFAFVAVMVNGASTISTNISTGGTLSVTGDSTLTGNVFATSTLAVTGKSFFYDQLALNSAASDPTGVTAGSLYYNTADRVVKLYNGSGWLTVASSTDAFGGLVLTDDVGVRFNAIATNYMALGTTTLPVVSTSGNSLLFLNATTAASVPFAIQGWAGQTGDLVQILNDVNSELFAIDAVGHASTTILSTSVRVDDALVVSGYATTSGASGNFATEGTLTVTGTQTFTGAMSANGAVTLGDGAGDAIIITGNASTTNALTVRGLSFDIAGYATTTIDLTETFATTTLGRNTEDGGGAALGVGTSTPVGKATVGVVGDIWVGSTATTTFTLDTNATTGGTCIQMVASDGDVVRLFVDTGNALLVQAGACSEGGS